MSPLMVIQGLALIGGGLLYALLLASRLLWLAPSRFGWVMYLANLAWELLEKRSHRPRAGLELAGALVSLALLGGGLALWGGWHLALHGVALLAVLLLALEVVNRGWERQLLTGIPARLDTRGVRGCASAAAPPLPGPPPPGGRGREVCFPAPSVHPDLTLTLEGPFVARLPAYQLGTLAVGVPVEIGLIIGNHTPAPTQWPVRVCLKAPAGWLSAGEAQRDWPVLAPGAVARLGWTLTPDRDAAAGALDLEVTWDGETRCVRIGHEGCRRIAVGEIQEVAIRRYPGARRAAFAWRGDMDLYDTSSFQSIAGLEVALGLGARYGIAQSLFLSTRLSLDEGAARAWADHYGVDRGAAEIPSFIAWLLERVALRHRCPYPAVTERPYVMELGNHGHLHFDTDTAGAPENGWRAGARAGEGHPYPWVGEDRTSFGEQRDNILEAQRWCEGALGFRPRSWAKPGRGNDSFTPAAVAAAGLEVASGSDIRARDNALRQPPPHHPVGTDLVELTARYPSDPQHFYHWAMLRFWLHRAWRLGIPMVLLVHQHLRQFAGGACARLTEALLREAVASFNGDLYLDTVYGIGAWWRDVLSPRTAVVRLSREGGCLRLTNGGERDLEHLPVDIRLTDGGRLTRLVTVPAGKTVEIALGSPGLGE
jgi:hypothetical protein